MKSKLSHTWAAARVVGCLLVLSLEAPGPAASGSPASPVADAPLRAAEKAARETRTLVEDLNLKTLWLSNTPGDWLVLLASIVGGLAAGKLAAALLRRVAGRWQARGWHGRALLLRGLASPASLALLALGLTVGTAGLEMSPEIRTFWLKVLLLLYSIAAFWYAYNLVALSDVLLHRLTSRSETTLDQQVAPLMRKSLRMFLVLIGLLFVADSVFGQDIGAWLAGLGIAGLAVSLAAQDSLKNLFGSITILLDRPFRIGDEILVAGYDGTVEEIGFRSTKLRTAQGSLVNIPNSSIVNSPVENVSRRPCIRRSVNLTIVSHTPAAKTAEAVEIVRHILAEAGIREPIHQVIEGRECPPRVHLSNLAPEGLSISVTYCYAPPAYWDCVEHAQKVNLRICEEFAKAGIALAGPLPNP